jgi:hypothetical protein
MLSFLSCLVCLGCFALSRSSRLPFGGEYSDPKRVSSCKPSEQSLCDNVRRRRQRWQLISELFMHTTSSKRLPEDSSIWKRVRNCLWRSRTSDPLIGHDIILDTRKAQSAMSVIELWHLAAEVSKLRKAFSRKTAVLCRLEEFDQAEFFALCAKNRGFQVQAFTSFEDAFEWLIAKG